MTPTLTDADIARLEAQQQQPKAKPALTDADIAAHDQGQATPTTNLLDQPGNQFLYTTKEGIPVYGPGPKPISIPLYPGGPRTPDTKPIGPPQGLDKPLTTGEKLLTAPLEYERAGMEQLGQGLHGIAHPQSGEQMAGAASDVIRGGFQTATPLLLPEAVAKPFSTIAGLFTFGGAQAAVEHTAKGLGLPEGYARLAGDIGGIYGGAKAHSWLSDMAKLPDRKVADDIFKRLQMSVDALKDPTLNPDERAGAKAMADSLLQSLKQEEGVPIVPKLFQNPNAMQRSAYDYMRTEVGVAPSAAAATGSPFVRGAQWLTGVTPAGALMDQAAQKTNLEAIRGHAAKLVQQLLPEEGPSRSFYHDFEGRVDASEPQNVPLSVGRDGSQISGNVKAPVDIRELKYEMQPLFDKMQFMPMADRSASSAYSALDALLKSPDHVPAPTAEWGLSQFKAAAREEAGGVSEGIAKRIIPQLQASIDNSVKTYAGDDALTSLQKGRVAAAKEAGADWLSQRFNKAQAAGGFDKEKVLWNEWARLPDTGKRSMYTPEQVDALNKFFLGLRQYGENPNPSGSALVLTLMGQGAEALHGGVVDPTFWMAQLGSAGMAKVLRSDMGVKLLTEGLRIPRTTERGQFIQKKLQQILKEPGPGEGGPGGPGTPPPGGRPSGGPSGPQVAPPQGRNAPPGAQGATAEPGMLEAYPELLSEQEPTPGEISKMSPAEAKAAIERARTTAREGSYVTRQAAPVKPALPTAPDVTIPTDAAIQQGATGARPEVSGPLQPASENQRAETQVSVPGSSRQYKARYQVIELKDLQSSHNGQTFQPNPNYKYVNDRDYTRAENQGKIVSGSSPGQFDPRYLLTDNPDASNGPPVTSEGHAMGGNGRSMMLQRVYATNPQGATSYRNLLTLKARQFGLDPEQIRGMKQPVLVREIDPSEFEQGGQQNAVTDFNKVGTASLRGSEKAVADSRRVSQGTLDHIAGRLESGGEDATLSEVLDGRGGADILNRLIQDGVVSPQESAAYVDRGELTADGKTRISKLMLGRFFRDPRQLDATAPSIRNKLERIAAPLAKVESRPQWSLAQPMQQALDLIEEARAHGQKNLDDMVSQSGLFGSQNYSPEAVALAKMLQNAKPNDITRAVRQYAQEATDAEQGAGLFGEPPTPAESFDAAFGKHR